MSFLERNNICHRLKRSIVSQTKTQVARGLDGDGGKWAGWRSLSGLRASWVHCGLIVTQACGLWLPGSRDTSAKGSGRRQNSHPPW